MGTPGDSEACPTENTLSAFVDGGLAAGELGLLETHLADCADCRKLVATAVRHTAPKRAPLAAGKRLHRYVIEGLLGRGAMGEVYAAFDPELQRKIAVKILDQSWSVDETGRARLLREAQAIAKVSHPNVIVVHDVGTFDDEVFIAMSLVGGGTLREWLAQGGRSLDAIVEVFVAAGRGLAAAHAQGLVHRDFKPDNVLIEGDVPRVSDFGLALPPDELAGSGGEARPATVELTVTGALVGTPAYMSPEQWTRQEIDARSDQFSFCVALYEAATGSRPFPGATLGELFTAVTAGPRPRGARLPAWLRRVVLRGLEIDRTRRYPSMDALCDELGRGLRRKRRSALWIAGGAAFGLLLGTGLFVRQQTLCRGFEAQLHGAYDSTIRARLGRSLAAFSPPTEIGQIVNLLDQYAKDWVSGREVACRATRISGEQSEATLDLRMACLEDRRSELGRLAEVLSQADADVARGALRAVTSLSSMSDCSDVARLTGETPPPEDPALRRQIRGLREQLSQLRVSYNLARYQEARATLDKQLPTIQATKYPPLVAEAYYIGGQLATALGDYPRAETELREAALAAELARDDRLRAEAWVELVQSQMLAKKAEAALATYRQAEVAVSRVHRPSIEARLLRSKAVMAVWKDDYATAMAIAETALAKVRSEPPGVRDERIEARLVQDLGLYLLVAGRAEEALRYSEEALAILKRLYGENHPYMADIYDSTVIIYRVLGRHKTALQMARRALDLRQATLGKTHVRVVESLKRVAEYELSFGNLAACKARLAEIEAIGGAAVEANRPDLLDLRARVAMVERRWADGEKLYRELLAIPVPAGTSEELRHAGWQGKLAEMMAEQGQTQSADRTYAVAMARYERLLPADDQDLTHERRAYARYLYKRGRLKEAKVEIDRVLAAYERKQDKSDKRRFDALTLLAKIEAAQGARDAARRHWEEALTLARANAELADETMGRALLDYARLRLDAGERGAVIVGLLDEARPLLEGIDTPDPEGKKELADAYSLAKR